MNKPTPGPWIVEGEFVYANNPLLRIADTTVADGDEDRLPDAVADANTYLIAAAPDLLEVCRQVAALLQPELTKEPERTIFWSAVAAIAKAEGR